MFFFFDNKPVVNKMNNTNLEYIIICKLFGENDVKLNFNKEVNIYIGENGLGKTTILNCVYYLLKKKFDKLLEIDFSEICVKLKTCKAPFVISKSDINDYVSRKHLRHGYYSNNDISFLIKDFVNEYNIDVYDKFDMRLDEKIEKLTRKVARYSNMPLSVVRNLVFDYLKNGEFSDYINKNGNFNKVKKLADSLDTDVSEKILYLTTYRRIENDFSTFFRKDDSFGDNDMLIKFGMSDVEKSIESILELIRENSRESFNKMTGVLLKKYASGAQSSRKKLKKPIIDKEMLKIIFDRLGNEIAENDREKIFSLLDDNRIYNEEYIYLLDLIINLIENYNKQKIYDDKIKKFTETCNKYLNEKQFVYNQSELKLEILMWDRFSDNKNNNKTIELSKLSSGEKQIVSLFSKLYLENEQDSILIIDEPELSISMKWQKMLLPDIMRSNNCKLLLTVTHSPFIFENEFDDDAKDMRNCIIKSAWG